MGTYLLSPAARADLREIRDSTAEKWSAGQADRYMRALGDACGDLASGTRQGRRVDSIRSGYRSFAVAAHVLFYRTTEAGQVDVVRILPQRMDLFSPLEA